MAISDRIVPDNPANNFATLNPLMLRGGALSEGNLKLSGGGNNTGSFSNLLIPKTGKYYVEVRTNDTTDDHALALFPNNSEFNISNQISTNSIYITSYGGGISITTNNSNTSLGSVSETATTSGDVLGYLVDIGNGIISIFKNGVHKLTITNWSPLDLEYAVGYNVNTTWPACNKTFNFGQDPTFIGTETPADIYTDVRGLGRFLYQPPTGALSLCTQNIPEPAISIAQSDSPNKHFIALRWGIYSSTASIPDNYTVDEDNDGNSARNTIAFNPDLVWVKSMANAHNHVLFDSVRGFGKNILYTNNTNAEGTDENGHVSSVTNNKVNFASGSSGRTNWTSSGHYIGWFWRAGGQPASDGVAMVDETATTTAALKNAASATITPTRMSVNTTAGFSIIKWVGNNTNNATIPHGLTKTPDFVLLKNTSDSVNWLVKLNPNTIPAVSNEQQYLYLNLTNPFGTNTGEETQLTSNTIKFVGTNLNPSNGSGDNMIAYCWHSVPGYSAFGSYTGNGSTDGPFIYTGFRPAWVMIKNTSNGGSYSSWMMVDSTRSAFNTSGGGNTLWANRSFAEGRRGADVAIGSNDYLDIDLVSNGIKIRSGGNNTENNDNTVVYIYMAFASQSINFNSAR